MNWRPRLRQSRRDERIFLIDTNATTGRRFQIGHRHPQKIDPQTTTSMQVLNSCCLSRTELSC